MTFACFFRGLCAFLCAFGVFTHFRTTRFALKSCKKALKSYDFKAFGAAIKAARTGRKESRKKVSDEMYISPRYLANIENNGQHPSLQIFFELMLRYHISVDQFLLDTQPEKDTKRRQLDALLDDMSDTGIRIVTATAKEIAEVENEN